MPTVRFNSNIQADLGEILLGIAELEVGELEKFAQQVSAILAQKKAPHLPKKEAELLIKINKGVAFEVQSRYDELHKKMQDGELSSEEHKELIGLVDIIEIQNAKRMKYLVELSQLRNVPLRELIKELELNPPAYV